MLLWEKIALENFSFSASSFKEKGKEEKEIE